MLPFLKKQSRPAGISIEVRKPDHQEPESSESPALEAAAQDILRALEDKDSRHLALALRAAFQILDSEPHAEGPHLEEEDME